MVRKVRKKNPQLFNSPLWFLSHTLVSSACGSASRLAMMLFLTGLTPLAVAQYGDYGGEDETSLSSLQSHESSGPITYASVPNKPHKLPTLSGRCEPEYLGCFPDDPGSRAVTFFAGRIHSPSQCALLCAHRAAKEGISWAGLVALQNPTTQGVECFCAKDDDDHTKHVLEDSKCMFEDANGVCARWVHTTDASSTCEPCPYPHDKELCGGKDTNSIYHVGHCGESEGTLTSLQLRENALHSHTKSCSNVKGTNRRFILNKRGCVKDDPSKRVFSGGFTTVDTPWECAYVCGQNGFLAFGIEFGNECFCTENTHLDEVLANGQLKADDPLMCDTVMCARGEEFCGGDHCTSSSAPPPLSLSFSLFLSLLFREPMQRLSLSRALAPHLSPPSLLLTLPPFFIAKF